MLSDTETPEDPFRHFQVSEELQQPLKRPSTNYAAINNRPVFFFSTKISSF